MSLMAVSVIIPALNEEACIASAIASLRADGAVEIIVVDGGSTDGTLAQAQGADLVLSSARTRAKQMNAGAARAQEDVFLFLHADCVLDRGALAAAEHALRESHVAACCFTMRVCAGGVLYRMIDGAATMRTRFTGLIYGDQGLAVRRADFERLGGFPELRLMEDIYFSRRLSGVGRVRVLSKRIHVSPRRWQQAGIVRQSVRNWTLTALAAAGVSPDALARFYPDVR